jgi:signal transduction histidine kinase
VQLWPNWFTTGVQCRIGSSFGLKFAVPLVLLIFLEFALFPIQIRAAGIPPKKNAVTVNQIGLSHLFRTGLRQAGNSRLNSSIVEFREPSLWCEAKWIWISGLFIIFTLFGLILYMRFSRQQLKLARDRLLNLSGMLISAEERERSRLAAELHDDFSQRLAVLSLKLQTAAEALPSSPEEANRQLCDLQNAANEIGSDLHALSHRLHSSTLERLGLVPGIRALCREFSMQQGIEVSFSSDPIPESVPPDTALCLFRIVQEGLRNLKKHSGVAQAQVSLRSLDEKLAVSVCDRGVGFDLKELRTNGGLGIQSMENRARFLGGHFEIQSSLGKGTSIDAWVPLHQNHNS